MKRKRLDRNTSWGFQYFPYYQMRLDCDDFHGRVSVIFLTEGKYQYWRMAQAGNVPVCGADMLWLQLIPDDTHRLITASCILREHYDAAHPAKLSGQVVVPVNGEVRETGNVALENSYAAKNDESGKKSALFVADQNRVNQDDDKNQLLEGAMSCKGSVNTSEEGIPYRVTCWYIDVTERIEEDPDGVWAFVDKYLDVILSPQGDVVVMDRDELDEAYQTGDLTTGQYEDAIAEGERIVEELGTDIPATEGWTERILSKVLQRIETGEKPIEKSIFVAMQKDKMIEQIQAELFSLQDSDYKTFHSKLMPTIDPDTIIGVRTPALRALARQLQKLPGIDLDVFKANLPHKYYEENNLHAFLIEQCRDYDTCIWELDCFLPYVDNWATCDMMRPKCFKHHTKELLTKAEQWLASGHTYTVRFAIETLMVYFLDEKFDPKYLAMVAAVQSDEYYINMMIAWYFATALAKQWQSTLPYLTEERLPLWVHNKTIQKAVESYRITPEQKKLLRGLRRK